MKIGYPCINRTIGCTPNKTFRLASYSEKILKEKIKQNLDCLKKTLEFNVKNNLLFFRIGSGLVPFASHPICIFNWQRYFKKYFLEIGEYIKKNGFRISMHPDQFVLINSLKRDVIKKSIKELNYHCDVLNLMDLDESAKVQIHVGGVYKNKNASLNRFINNYKRLNKKIKKRLVIENDHMNFSFKDCLWINKKIDIPIVFDVFHHECLNNNEKVRETVIRAKKTWKKKDGVLMVDYSNQKVGARKGSHEENINLKKFKKFLRIARNIDFDIMLEIKDKEKSALKAIKLT
ncbi:MAG: UV damage repair endonuclease UvdE [Chlamydiae bacterium SM23_39]|nr:MAG: UV damage repair endonuclease UvdE [Chlamydiae bacterium SM23_39]